MAFSGPPDNTHGLLVLLTNLDTSEQYLIDYVGNVDFTVAALSSGNWRFQLVMFMGYHHPDASGTFTMTYEGTASLALIHMKR